MCPGMRGDQGGPDERDLVTKLQAADRSPALSHICPINPRGSLGTLSLLFISPSRLSFNHWGNWQPPARNVVKNSIFLHENSFPLPNIQTGKPGAGTFSGTLFSAKIASRQPIHVLVGIKARFHVVRRHPACNEERKNIKKAIKKGQEERKWPRGL